MRSAGVLYSNALGGPADVADWVPEGPLSVHGHEGTLELSGALDDADFGDHAHWTFWCPEEFPDGIRISWEFRPLEEPGLAMLFFAAAGQGGLDLFSPDLAPRTGFYPQYHSGDIDALTRLVFPAQVRIRAGLPDVQPPQERRLRTGGAGR
ncbi:DUF1961 family protein [Pseudarthrobacter sp. SORGH_AS 212]|uniref:DUF1961 family protein n=1 Tax=Pseudarthrobacter sp. SORGH_AS 212 TaxID=3041777 RepID=UPI0032B75802